MVTSRQLESAVAWYGALLVVALVVLVSQSVIASELGLGLDLSAVLVVFFAVELEMVPGLWLAWITAWIADALAGGPPGLVAIGLLGAFLMLRIVLRRSPSRAAPVVISLSVVGFVAAAATRYVVHQVLGPEASWPPESLGRLAAVAGFAVPLHALLRKVGDLLRPRDEVGIRR